MTNQSDADKAAKVDDQKFKHDAHEPGVFTEAEAAAFLKMTPRMLADRRRAGKIRCVHEGKYLSYTRDHLDEFCRNNSKRRRTRQRVGENEVLFVSVEGRSARSVISKLMGQRLSDMADKNSS